MNASLTLSADPSSARQARRFATGTLDNAGISSDVVQLAEIVVSELATNAVLHAHGSFTLTITVSAGTDAARPVRIEVADEASSLPSLRMAEVDAMSGRGLAIVAALTSEWGVESKESGKVVWCTLSGDDREPALEG